MTEEDVATLTVRRADEADLPAVLALYDQPDMDAGRVLSLAQAQVIFGQVQQYPNYDLYVAELASAIVGSFALLIMPNLGHLGTPSGILEDLVVAPDRQGRGIGRALVERAIRLCAAAGCYKLTLSSNLRRTRAHRFYQRIGFIPHGLSFRMDLDRESASTET